MKVTRPTTTEPLFAVARLAGSFILDEEVVASVERAFSAICGPPNKTLYRIVARDGTQYEVERSSDIGQLPIDDLRQRRKFEIELWAGEVPDLERAHLIFDFEIPANVAITAYSAKNASFLAKQMRARVDASRAWYSWIHSTWFVWGLSPLLYLAGTLLPSDILGESRLARPEILAVFILLASVFLIWLGRRSLFDPLVLEWSGGRKRQQRLIGARRVVFGVLILGFCSMLLNALVVRWLT